MPRLPAKVCIRFVETKTPCRQSCLILHRTSRPRLTSFRAYMAESGILRPRLTFLPCLPGRVRDFATALVVVIPHVRAFRQAQLLSLGSESEAALNWCRDKARQSRGLREASALDAGAESRSASKRVACNTNQHGLVCTAQQLRRTMRIAQNNEIRVPSDFKNTLRSMANAGWHGS